MIFLVLFLLLLVLKLQILNTPYHWDSMLYIVGAHWIKDAHFNPLCYNRFPLLPELLACAWAILGDSLWVSHLLNIFVSSIGLYFTYLIGTYLFSMKTGVISALLLLVCPLYFAQSGILNHEILLTALSLATIYFAQKDKIKLYLISASLLVLAKEVGFLTIAAIFIWQLFKYSKKRILMRKLFICGIPLIFLLIWRMVSVMQLSRDFYYGFITFDWVSIKQTFKNRFLELFVNDFRWIITFFIGLRFIVYKGKYMKEQFLILALVSIVYFSFFSIIKWGLVRYLMPIYPLFFIIGTESIVRISRDRKLFLYTMVTVIIFLSISQFYNNRIIEYNAGSGAVLESNMEYLDVVITHKQAAEYIEKNYPDAVVLTTWPQYMELSHPYLGYVKKPINIKIVYSNPPPDLSRIDLIYYSPQGHNHLLLLEKIHTLDTFLLKKFERNKKYTAIYKVKK